MNINIHTDDVHAVRRNENRETRLLEWQWEELCRPSAQRNNRTVAISVNIFLNSNNLKSLEKITLLHNPTILFLGMSL